MNSICCFSYFWSLKRFPGHQQKIPNVLGNLCKFMARWARSLAHEFMWPTDIYWCQPQWIQPKEGGEKKHPLGLLLKTQSETLDYWYSWHPPARILILPLCSPSASQTQGTFLQWSFHFHRKTATAAEVDQTQTATCMQTARTIPFAHYRSYCARVAVESL